MSKWLSKADALCEFIRAVPAVEGMAVEVHRADDLINQVNIAIEKAAGQGVVIIKWLGGANPDRKSSVLRMGSRYSISLWTMPMLDVGSAAADDIIEQLAEALHGYGAGVTGMQPSRLEVVSVEVVPPPPGYLVHEILCEVTRLT